MKLPLLEEACQAQLAVTAKDPVPPETVKFCDFGAISKLHEAAACITVTVLAAMVMVPVRAKAVMLASTVYCTVPLPVVLNPEVMCNHETLETAVQPLPKQLPGILTKTWPLKAAADVLTLVGLTVNSQN